MVVIRLARGGAKKRPFYRVVVADKRCSRDGRYIERLGHFNPVAQGNEIRLQLNMERIEDWIGKGAQTSDRVHALLKEWKFRKENPDTPTRAEKKAAANKQKTAAKANEAAAPADTAE